MHTPVLLKETIEILDPKTNENYIDATFGEGGLSFELVRYIKPDGKILAFEWDPELYQIGLKKLQKMQKKNIKLVNKNFREIKKVVRKERFFNIKGVVFDLGISNWHYENSKRGFSFKKDEPLDMRINPKEIKIKAFDIVNYAKYEDLVYIFKNFGEEREAENIAKEIIKKRKEKKIETSKELSEIILKTKREKTKIHPATKVFMALRVFLNEELENLKIALEDSLDVLEKGGKIVIISFQGLEDKVIKKIIKDWKRKKRIELITKNVIRPKKEEIAKNPKSRSAKLRALKKIE